MGYTRQTAIDASGIYRLFEHAIAKKLQRPHVRLLTSNNRQVALKLASPNSKNNAGCIYVTDGGSFDSNTYYGKIDRTGRFCSTSDTTPEVFDVLARFSKNPAKVAAEYGKLTGHCCMCGLPLTDPRSTAMGYGPVCADHFGLEWGTDKTPIKSIAAEVSERIANSIPMPEDLLQDFSTPTWAKAVIEVALDKEAVDAANTFAVLAQSFDQRAKQILRGSL